MSFTSVALQMVTVSLPILLGWCISKLGFMKAEFERELSRLLLQVALPCLVLSSALGDDVQLPSVADTFSLMGLSIVMYVVAIVIAFAVTLSFVCLREPSARIALPCSLEMPVLSGFRLFRRCLASRRCSMLRLRSSPSTYLCLPSVSCSLVVHKAA